MWSARILPVAPCSRLDGLGGLLGRWPRSVTTVATRGVILRCGQPTRFRRRPIHRGELVNLQLWASTSPMSSERWLLAVFHRALLAMQRRRAKRLGLGDPKSGTVTAIRRCGSDLNVNVHFHTLMPDGVFVEAGAAGGDARVPSAAATFGPAAPPRAGRAGIADRGQYAIRDTFISHALTAGEDPAWVAELCGTSEQMIFRHYRGFLRGSLNGAEHGR